MRVIYKSIGYKICAVLRFCFLSFLWYRRSMRINKMSMIGKDCDIYILGKGEITGTGRIIINDHVMLYSKGKLSFGDNAGINSYSRIVAHEEITMGNHVTIGQMVSILDHDHKYTVQDGKLKLDGYTTAPIIIGDHVWIGDKVSVLKGVTIGSNVVVGAHTLVNKDVPDNCVIGGNPFRILKRLS